MRAPQAMSMTTTLITGSNKGLGKEAARQLIAAGHTVYIGARDEARGRAAAGGLGAPLVPHAAHEPGWRPRQTTDGRYGPQLAGGEQDVPVLTVLPAGQLVGPGRIGTGPRARAGGHARRRRQRRSARRRPPR